MNISKKIIYIVTALVVATSLSVRSVQAHSLTDKNKLATRLAQKFALNEQEVKKFLIEYEQEREQVRHQEDAKSYEGQRSEHLNYIDRKLTKGVEDGWFTAAQKNKIMSKLKEKMDQGPALGSYRTMSESERQGKINSWRKEMGQWSIKNGFTLDRIRNITGKGNKYLMGMEL